MMTPTHHHATIQPLYAHTGASHGIEIGAQDRLGTQSPLSHRGPLSHPTRASSWLRGARVAAMLALTGAFASTAAAQTVVVAPLIPNNASEKVVYGIHQLIVSELDFMSGFSGATEIAQRPAQLNFACLANTSCLSGIMRAGGGDALITGTLTDEGSNVLLDLVYFDGKRIVRRQAFTLKNDPTVIANSMTSVLKEVITGQNPKAAAEADKVPDFTSPAPSPKGKPLADDDDFFFDDPVVDAGPTPAELAARRQAEEASRRAEEDARRRAEDESRRRQEDEARRRQEEDRRRAEEERRRQEEAARAAAEAEARRRAEDDRQRQQEAARAAAAEQARRQAQEDARWAAEEDARRRAAAAAVPMPAPAPAPAFDPGMISFGAAADKITAEDINAVINFGPTASTVSPRPPGPAPYSAPAPRPGAGGYDTSVLPDEEADLRALSRPPTGALQDLDGPAPRDKGKPSKSPSSKQPKPGATRSSGDVERSGPQYFQLSARAGFSKYHAFNFITAGAELGIPFGKTGLMGLAGIETYSVNRQVPPDFIVEGGPTSQWNTIYPVNFGLAYRFKTGGMAQPYIGADIIFASYYSDPLGTDWAGGGRARGGVDLMVAKNFGLNLNLAIGGWTGQKWNLIDAGVQNSGLFPQISAGTVVAF